MRPLCWKIRIEGLQIFIWKLDLKARGHLIEFFDKSMGGRLVNIENMVGKIEHVSLLLIEKKHIDK